MKLLVATDAHIFRTPDGKHWAKSIYGYSFWTRYLDVFDSVRIVARVKDVQEIASNILLVDGPGIEVFGIPFYQGPLQLLKKYYRIHKCLRGINNGCDAVLLRMPSQTATMVWKHLTKKIPLAGEIVYDMMDDVNIPNQNIILKVLNIITSNNVKKFCMQANGVSYVTKSSIQKHYPSYAKIHGETKEHFETYYSTITLSENAFTGARDFSNCNELTLVLSSVAMNSERKGEKILIKTVKICRDRGYNVKAIIIGDGTLRSTFEQYAKELGVLDNIEFTGLLPSSDEVRKVMLRADVFVFPTQGEGLPRGILEAMAIGMPVLSTPVGGIPEIIDKKYLFDPKDFEAYANEVCSLIDNPTELNTMSTTNFNKSKEFKNDLLQMKRNEFYEKLKLLC
ncbi:MAG: glycosyltransferase family 4 protein [Lachnospiraceae bacterium]|nr:glycosyltransferase family 4 protein [Lachnospiraceae bacterium]